MTKKVKVLFAIYGALMATFVLGSDVGVGLVLPIVALGSMYAAVIFVLKVMLWVAKKFGADVTPRTAKAEDEVAADFAMSTLAPGGHFVTKVFRGGTEQALLTMLKRAFASVHHVKPPASRAKSVELYLVARDFRGRPTDQVVTS